VCVCTHTYTYICTYTYTHTNTHTQTYIYLLTIRVVAAHGREEVETFYSVGGGGDIYLLCIRVVAAHEVLLHIHRADAGSTQGGHKVRHKLGARQLWGVGGHHNEAVCHT
jgi:hypothetical protein